MSKIIIYNDVISLEKIRLYLDKIGLKKVQNKSRYIKLKQAISDSIHKITVFQFYVNKDDRHDQVYDVFIFNRSYNLFIKFIDFENATTHTKFLNEQSHLSLNFINLTKNFNESLVIKFNHNKKFFDEKILFSSRIDYQKFEEFPFINFFIPKVYNYIYQINLSQVSSTKRDNLFRKLSGNDRFYINSLCYNYYDILTSEYPINIQHGDLISDNVLMLNNEISIIDYEHCNRLYFFYDMIFFIISHRWMRRPNHDNLIKVYFEKSFDIFLYDLFRIHNLNIKFNKDFKIYLIVLTMSMRRIYIDKIKLVKKNKLKSIISRDQLFLKQVNLLSE